MDIFDMINEDAITAARTGDMSWDAATAISQILKLESEGRADEVMLATRLLGGGADPASLEYLETGRVSEKVAEAHRAGPGVFKHDDPERQHYLTLCALSEDEAQDSTMRSRVIKFAHSLRYLGTISGGKRDERLLAEMAAAAEREYLDLPFTHVEIGGQVFQLYAADGGHAAAVWRDEPQTRSAVYGVFNGAPYIALGAPPHAPGLAKQGVSEAVASKQKDPRFWIVEDAEILARAANALVEASIDVPGAVPA